MKKQTCIFKPRLRCKTSSGILTAAAAFVVAALLPLPQGYAAALQGVTVSEVSSEYVVTPDVRVGTNVLSDAGLYGDLCTVGPRAAMWMTSLALPEAPASATITFDLGSLQTVHQIKVWNYNEAGTYTLRGVQKADIQVAGEDFVFTTLMPAQTFDKAPGTFTNFAQTMPVPDGAHQARYFRFNVLTNWGGGSTNVGLSKVRFINTNLPVAVKTITRNYTGDRVTVRFSETVLPLSATNLANYTLKQGSTPVALNSAAMDWRTDRVVLTTMPLTAGLPYTLTVQGIQDAAGNAATMTATDFTIAPEFILWLKADAGVNELGGMVMEWADQSGAGNNSTLLPGATPPEYVPTAINGKPSVRFDGANTALTIPHGPNISSDNEDMSFFAVVNLPAITNYGMILNKAGSRNPNYAAPWDFEIAPSSGYGKSRFLRGLDSNASGLVGTANIVSNQTYLIELVVNGTNFMVYQNGFANGTVLIADALGDCGNPVWIGKRPDTTGNGYPFLGDLPELMLMRGTVSASERLGIEAYLAKKYGVTTPVAGPPSINSSPASQTVYVGDTVTLTASVSTNGLSPKTLQWYRSPATAIAGATSNVLVLENISLADDQKSFYLSVTNGDGSAATVPTVLTVLPVTTPYFVVQPQPVTIYPNQTATFTSLAQGNAAITYQWYRNGTALTGATRASITVVNVRTNEAGTYHVVALNSLGSKPSDAVALNVVGAADGTFLNAVIAANPALYYRFSEVNTSTNALNYGNLGAAGNGFYVGNYSGYAGPAAPFYPDFEVDNPAVYNSDITKDGGAVKFPKISLYNTVGGAHTTMAAWVYNGVPGGGQVPWAGILYSRATGVGTCGLSVGKSADKLSYVWNAAANTYNFDTGMSMPAEIWTFVAVSIEPTNAIVFMNDGSGMRTITNTVAHAAIAALEGYVGSDNGYANRKWWGAIDEPMIFDRALTVDQVNALYTATAMYAQPTAPRIAINGNATTTVVTWPARSGVLQSAGSLAGPWTEMIGVPSPYTFTPSGEQSFFRVRAQ